MRSQHQPPAEGAWRGWPGAPGGGAAHGGQGHAGWLRAIGVRAIGAWAIGVRGVPGRQSPGQQSPGRRRVPPGKHRVPDVLLTVAAYLALVLFGMSQGLLGSFFYASGTVPLAALGFALAIGATCLLGGWGMRSPVGGLAPAVGWFIVVFLLATGTNGGSVVITATTAGEFFLFGGSACVAVGVVTCFALWSRPARGRSR